MSDFVMTRLTAAGAVLELELNPVRVRLDGREAEIIHQRLYRDGGSRSIMFMLDDGGHHLLLSRRLQSEPYETLDGERLEEGPRP